MKIKTITRSNPQLHRTLSNKTKIKREPLKSLLLLKKIFQRLMCPLKINPFQQPNINLPKYFMSHSKYLTQQTLYERKFLTRR